MTMQKPLHPRDDIDRIYVPRKGGRGLISIEDSVDASIQRLEDYIEKCGGKLITATRKNIDNTRINRTKIPRKQKWGRKNLWTFDATNNRHLTQENVDVAKKGKP